MRTVKGLIDLIRTRPAACLALVAAAYAAGQMIYNVTQHAGVFDPQVIVALLAALGALGVHPLVTPVARPRARVDGRLVRLVPEDTKR
jgi:hypothetical protein